MPDTVGVRLRIAIVVAVASVVLVAALGVLTARSGSQVPCSSFPNGRTYCTQTVTIQRWCPFGFPCPHIVYNTTLRGVTFQLFGLVDRDGTPGIQVSITPSGDNFELESNPFGLPASWVSPDSHLFVSWSNSPAAWSGHEPGDSAVVCGVAES